MASVNYDFIVVGGGSSGSVLASMLSRKGSTLLIERGTNHTAYQQSSVRQGWPQISALTFDMLQNRGSGHWSGTANILGGGSALNGAVCWRGEREVFEDLGLNLDGIERSFKILEDHLCSTKEDSAYDMAFINAWKNHGFLMANSTAGLASWSDDAVPPSSMHLPTIQRGRSLFDLSNKRKPASYLFEHSFPNEDSSILDQGNLTVFLLTKAKRVLFTDTKEAIGVDISSPAGDFSVYVRKSGKIFLNAGAYETPKLLMLSGIGPSTILSNFGINIVHDNPEVGNNLIERKEIAITLPMMRSLEGDDISMLDVAVIGEKYWTSIAHKYAAEWGNASQGCNACAPVNRTRTCIDQLLGALTLYGIDRDAGAAVIYVSQRRPLTRGKVSLASSNYNDNPIVDDGWNLTLQDLTQYAKHDYNELIEGLQKLVLDVIEGTSLMESLGFPKRNVTGGFPTEFLDLLNASLLSTHDGLDKCFFSQSFLPKVNQCLNWNGCSPTIPILPKDQDRIKESLFETVASSQHCSGSCKVGSVVDKGSLAVKGVHGLYISDLSVVARPVDIHPMMTAMAIGMMLGDSIESVPFEEYELLPVVFSIMCIVVILSILFFWILRVVCKDKNGILTDLTRNDDNNIATIWREDELDISQSNDNVMLMAWSGVSCTYEKGRGEKKKAVTTLSDNFGCMKEGEITAIMGPSGAGKSTLLDILGGRKSIGQINGNFGVLGSWFNASTGGVAALCKTIQGNSAYIPQQEYFYPTQTCEEAVGFQANMKFGCGNLDERKKIISACLGIVGLPAIKFAKRKIGGDLAGGIAIRGLSGGEKKRLALACVLALKPRLIFIDELTSGLDSENSFVIVKLLKDLSTERRVASMVIIHQPEPSVFALFDSLILLSKGRCMFSGNVCNLKDFYEQNYNESEPSDAYIAGNLITKASAFDLSSSDHYTGETCDPSVPTPGTTFSVPILSPSVNSIWKLYVVFQRNLTNQYIRNITNVAARMASYSALSAIIGAIFWQVGSSESERGLSYEEAGFVIGANVFLLNVSYLLPFATIPVFVYDKRFLAAESSLGLYQSWMYGASQSFLEFIFLTVTSIVETSIVFFMCGMANPSMSLFGSYFTVLSVVTVSGLVGSTLVLCCSIWLPTQDLAFLTASTISTISLALSGGFISFAQMPVLPKVLQWISPVKYSLQGLVIAQLTGTNAERVLYLSELNSPSTVSGNIGVLLIMFVCLSVLTVIGMARVKEIR